MAGAQRRNDFGERHGLRIGFTNGVFDLLAEVLAALEAVDLVVVFGDDTPLNLIRRMRPNVLVKAATSTRPGGGPRSGRSAGGEMVIVDLVPGFSTTRIVERSRVRRPRRR